MEAVQKEMNFCCFTPSTKSKFTVILVLIQLCLKQYSKFPRVEEVVHFSWTLFSDTIQRTFPSKLPFPQVLEERVALMERSSVGEDHLFWCPMSVFFFLWQEFHLPWQEFWQETSGKNLHLIYIKNVSKKKSGASFLSVFILARCLIGHHIQTLQDALPSWASKRV